MSLFELAVQDAHGIAVADRVRPDRIEVCAALSTGGLTPSIGLIERAVETGVPAHVLIRPREGGFEYDDDEKALIVADARRAIAAGAAGVVVGGIAAGRVDGDLVRRVADAVSGREVTFHRAFDQLGDLPCALEALAEVGATRVLTSGGAPSAYDGVEALRALVARSAGRVQVMAGAGVTSENAVAVASTGVDAVHASAKRRREERLAVSLGSAADAGAVSFATTDAHEAAAIRDALARGARP